MSAPAETRPRRAAARWTAVTLALASTLLMMGVIDLFTLPGWVDQRYEWEVPLEASWGALFTFFLAGAYCWLALFPGAPWPALALLALCSAGLALSAAAGADWRPLFVAVGVCVSGTGLWLLLGRPAVGRVPAPAPRRAPLALALLGLPLWLPYAAEAFARSRAGVLGSVTQGIEHWPLQGAVGVVIVLAALTLALWEPCRPLFRTAVSLSAVYIGMAELAYPDRSGAMGSLQWGVAVTLWGLLVALVAVPAPLGVRGPAPAGA